jgi:hypothetical protein
MDATWRAHADDAHYTTFECFFRNAHLHHRHGSVRELYYESTPRGKQPSQKIRWMPYM